MGMIGLVGWHRKGYNKRGKHWRDWDTIFRWYWFCVTHGISKRAIKSQLPERRLSQLAQSISSLNAKVMRRNFSCKSAIAAFNGDDLRATFSMIILFDDKSWHCITADWLLLGDDTYISGQCRRSPAMHYHFTTHARTRRGAAYRHVIKILSSLPKEMRICRAIGRASRRYIGFDFIDIDGDIFSMPLVKPIYAFYY